jgi:hypothetical protein
MKVIFEFNSGHRRHYSTTPDVDEHIFGGGLVKFTTMHPEKGEMFLVEKIKADKKEDDDAQYSDS